jgi:hypothetical protein
VRLFYQKVDLCDQMKEIDKQCPIEKGVTTIKKSVDLPKEIPPVGLDSFMACSNIADGRCREPTTSSRMCIQRTIGKSLA